MILRGDSTLLPNFHQISLPDLCDRHVFTSRAENSVDPDQLAFLKPAELNLHCFQNRIYPGLGMTRVK